MAHATTQEHAAITTILFTDLVGSTELLQQAGDEQAQRIFLQHHKLLSEVVATTSGQELQWLGDGLMAALPSTADAVRSAVAMQRASAQPVLGQRALRLLDLAVPQFESIGMPGWIRRAEELRQRLGR